MKYTLRDIAREKNISYAAAGYRVRCGDLLPDGMFGNTYLFTEATVKAFDPEEAGRRARELRRHPASFTESMVTVAEAAESLGIPLVWFKNALLRGAVSVDGKRSGVRFFWQSSVEKLRANTDLLRPVRFRTKNREQAD